MQVEAFEAWKVRELARIKRDREERDKQVRERCSMKKIFVYLLSALWMSYCREFHASDVHGSIQGQVHV